MYATCCVALSVHVAVNTPCQIKPAITSPFTCYVASTGQQNNLKIYFSNPLYYNETLHATTVHYFQGVEMLWQFSNMIQSVDHLAICMVYVSYHCLTYARSISDQ